MFELRWLGTVLQYRQRDLACDATGCETTLFGPWEDVPFIAVSDNPRPDEVGDAIDEK